MGLNPVRPLKLNGSLAIAWPVRPTSAAQEYAKRPASATALAADRNALCGPEPGLHHAPSGDFGAVRFYSHRSQKHSDPIGWSLAKEPASACASACPPVKIPWPPKRCSDRARKNALRPTMRVSYFFRSKSRVLFRCLGCARMASEVVGVSWRGPERPEVSRRANSRPGAGFGVVPGRVACCWVRGFVDPCGNVAARLPPTSESAALHTPQAPLIFKVQNRNVVGVLLQRGQNRSKVKLNVAIYPGLKQSILILSRTD